MEIADKPKVVLLDDLNPTLSLSSSRDRTMRTGFESTFHPQLIDPVGNTVDSALVQEHRLKTRLQNTRQNTPNVVAQTHQSSTSIPHHIAHFDRKRLGSLIGASETTTALSSTSASSSFIVTPKTEAANPISVSLAFATGQISSEKSLSNKSYSNEGAQSRGKISHHQINTTELLKSTSMAPQQGFTVSNSFFSKFKVKSWYQNVIQSKSQPIHHAEGSSSSQEDGALSKRSNSDSTEVESNASYSSPNTLSASTGGNLNSKGSHIDGLDHIQNVNHDPSNDSDGTVADLEELSSARRQRKYSFSSGCNSVDPEVNSGSCLPSSAAAEGSHAEVIAELPAEETREMSNNFPADDDDSEQDPVELFEEILTRQHMTEEEITASLHQLRQLIIAYGIPEKPSIRGKCWKLLLEVHHVSAQEYISLVKREKPQKPGEYNKIRDDTFRTMPTDRKFTDLVGEERITRVLCAFAWSTQVTDLQDTGFSFTYVQGMNVLVAPFLYTMTEMEAFYSFSNLIKYCCPLYVQPALQGVHCGIKLLEKCLSQIDNDLFTYLQSKKLTAELYALSSILTICACTPPLQEAMKLWDFLLAWGIHLNIICIIAQLHLIRDDLMKHPSPMKLLRKLPELNADKIIFHTMRMVKLLPDELYDQLVRHPYDPTVADQID